MSEFQSEFSIIIPAYNEAVILESRLLKLYENIKKDLKINALWEIILVENGSSDCTLEIAQRLVEKIRELKVLHLENPAYGKAIIEGVYNSSYSNIVCFNVDYFSVDFLNQALDILDKKGADIIVASKNLPESRVKRPWFRQATTYIFNYIILRKILRYSGFDTQGIKAFRKQDAESFLSKCHAKQFLFDTELLVKMQRKGFSIKDLPIEVEEIRLPSFGYFRKVKVTLMDCIRIVLKLNE